MKQYDAMIIGGGPAGASCAWGLVQAGFKVLVLDTKLFPRDKVCAGWITPAVIDDLSLNIADYRMRYTMQAFTGFRTGMIGQAMVATDYGLPVSYGIRRCEFDHYLLQRSGAQLQLGTVAKRIEHGNGQWLVNDEWAAPLLIGAGGHFCPVAKLLGAEIGQHELSVRAQEMEFELTAEQQAALPMDPKVPELYFCEDLAGYGWAVRKGKYLNIGLGREGDHALAQHVAEFFDYLIEQERIPSDITPRATGHAYLLYQHASRKVVDEGVLLIGDAAGLAYTQSGEGIRPAIESGLMAAQAIIAAQGDYRRNALQAYEKKLRKRFGRRPSRGLEEWVPAALKQQVAEKLLHSEWFTRHVILDRWFFHNQQPPLRI